MNKTACGQDRVSIILLLPLYLIHQSNHMPRYATHFQPHPYT